ncbi:MAG: DinB family protein [Ktedonobacterales bacterium]
MNQYFQEKWSWIDGTHTERMQLLDTLSDADLAFNPGGQSMSLGALCRESGDIEHSYIESLKTFRQEWSWSNTDAGLEGSVSQLKAWFQTLDDEMKALVEAFSDEDMKKQIERGGGFTMPVDLQLDVYLQALLIFLAKASMYFRMLNKPLPGQLQEFIG